MIRNIILTIAFIGVFSQLAWAQVEFDIEANAERPITPAFRITEQPNIIDTVIPIPDIHYPLLVKNLDTEIHLKDIDAAKIKITDKLDKLYPGYAKLGLGMYTSPLAEFYYNTTRNRRSNMGVHVKHFSSWKNLEGLSPSSFDNTSAKLFGEWFTSNFKLSSQIDYLNNGYHYYGIVDTTEFFTKDSLRNRVQLMGASFQFGNFTKRDSAKLMWSAHIGNHYFHEFQRPWDQIGDLHARNNNFIIGADFGYRQGRNNYKLDFDWQHNKYLYAEREELFPAAERFDIGNALITLRPTITTSGEKWHVVYGLDVNFDFGTPANTDKIFKVVPVVEGKYSLFNDMFIPYAGINGGVTQNSFYTLNRMNPFIYSGQEMRNETEYNFYGGIKGTLSKRISFNVAAHYREFSNKALFVNENTWSDLNKFDVRYEDMSVFSVDGSVSFQQNEKLKIDVMAEWNKYSPETQLYAWHLPEIKGTIRGSYNLFDKLYAKLDFTLEYGRKSPVYLFNQADDDIAVDMPLLADGNIHFEYRYNPRISAFLQLNNVAGQKYDRWLNYRVQGFQVLGGVTFGF